MKNRFFTAGHRYCFIFLLSIAIVCGSTSDVQAQSYYPDEFGNTWILQSTDGHEERLVRIEEDPEIIDGKELRVISDGTYPVSNPASNNPNKFFIKTEPDGVRIYRATATVQGFDVIIGYSPPETFLPVPIGLDSEWTVTGKARFLGLPVEVINAAKVVTVEPVTVPAGTFQNCLKIEQTFSASGLITVAPQSSTMWLAPDFGLVQSINSNGVTFELIDYNLTIGGIVVAVEPKGKLATTWGALKKR